METIDETKATNVEPLVENEAENCREIHSDEEQKTSNDDRSDFLKRFQEQRNNENENDRRLSRRVRGFYRDQNELIDGYERVQHQSETNQLDDQQIRTQKLAKILTKVSLAVNVVLFILKIIGAVISKSLAVISSVIDSAVDLTSSLILFWAWRAIKNRDQYRYPSGRTRLEPIAIVILSVVMCAASVLVIYESIDTITVDAAFFTENHNGTKTLQKIDMSALPVSVMAITIVSKTILFFLCYRIRTPTMGALAADHRNDVFSNIVALVFGLIGSFAFQGRINSKAIFVDPIGATLISIYIIYVWIRQANDQIKRLSGHTADSKFLSQIIWLTFNHSALIRKIDTVRAIYFGTSYLVEVDIVLPETMQLKEAHDIGESLQKRIENLPEVERAFVHIDYEYGHNPSAEHKTV